MTPSKSHLKTSKGNKSLISPRTPKLRNYRTSQSPTAVFVAGAINSPQAIWASQEIHDGVTWDYTSPLRQKLRSAKVHGKSHVIELLQCVNEENEQEKQQEDKTSLLETWMSVDLQNITPIQKAGSSNQSSLKRGNTQNNKLARHLAKELEELTEAIDKKDKSPKQFKTRYDIPIIENLPTPTSNLSRAELSADELWESANESFLIEATQLAEQAEGDYSFKKFIPPQSVNTNSDALKKDKLKKQNSSLSETKDDSLLQTTKAVAENYDFWDSDSSFEEIISSLPEDQLIIPGITSLLKNTKTESRESDMFPPNEFDMHQIFDGENKCKFKSKNITTENITANELCENIPFDINTIGSLKRNDSFETGNHPIFSKQAETKTIQKYTPEEIARKKEEALKRRQRKYQEIKIEVKNRKK